MEEEQDMLANLTEGVAGASRLASAEEFEAKYEMGAELGHGAFSVVHAVTSREDGREWAVKVMLKQRMSAHRTGEQQLRRLRDEMRALVSLRHPNVIGLEGTYETPTELYLVMDWAAGGELFDRIVAQGSFSEEHAAAVMRQILDVLDFMHVHGVIHRDIKPENILLTSTESWDIKVRRLGWWPPRGGRVADMRVGPPCGLPRRFPRHRRVSILATQPPCGRLRCLTSAS